MHVITSCTEITLTVCSSHPLLFQYIFGPLCWNKSQTNRCRTIRTCEPTGVLDLHVSQRLQRVLKGDAVQVQGSDAVVHNLGVGDELIRELLDLLRVQVPTQPVLRADRHRAAKHHLTWDNERQQDRWGEDGTKQDGKQYDGSEWETRTFLLWDKFDNYFTSLASDRNKTLSNILRQWWIIFRSVIHYQVCCST